MSQIYNTGLLRPASTVHHVGEKLMMATRVAPALVVLGIVAAVAVGGAGAAGPPIEAGEWEITVRTSMASVPGLPPQVARLMTQQGEKTIAVHYCVSAEDLTAQPAAMLGKRAAGCRYEQFSMSAGQLSLRAVCTSRDGAVTTTTSRGNYTPVSFAVTGETMRVGPTPTAPMPMTTATTGRRVAAVCTSHRAAS